MGHASRRCGSLCVPSPLQRGRQVLSDGGGEAHPGPAHAISHATTNARMMQTLTRIRTDRRAKTEQMRCITTSTITCLNGPSGHSRLPLLRGTLRGRSSLLQCHGLGPRLGTGRCSRQDPTEVLARPRHRGDHLARSRHPAPQPTCHKRRPLSRCQQALTPTNWSTKSQRRHLHYSYCCAPSPSRFFLQRPNKASALHLYSCTVSGRLTRTCGEDTTLFTG